MKTALVLSAGGMFAAYQAGAWKALASEFRADAVAGVSAGALNGWIIAGGGTPEELIAHWLDPSMAALMQKRGAFFDPAPLERKIRELFDSYRPQVPFGVVVVELRRLRARLIQAPDLDWRHLMASCAIPFGFPPVRIDGKLYVDGGLLGALPIWAAAEMGAGSVIAVNALPYVPSRWIRGFVRLVRSVAHPVPPPPPNLQSMTVTPSEPMGSLKDAIRWKRENALRWIELGERDALQNRRASAFVGG
jgi:NTE family protein